MKNDYSDPRKENGFHIIAKYREFESPYGNEFFENGNFTQVSILNVEPKTIVIATDGCGRYFRCAYDESSLFRYPIYGNPEVRASDLNHVSRYVTFYHSISAALESWG